MFYVIDRSNQMTLVTEYASREKMLEVLNGKDIENLTVIEGEERELISQQSIVLKGQM